MLLACICEMGDVSLEISHIAMICSHLAEMVLECEKNIAGLGFMPVVEIWVLWCLAIT